MGGRAGGAGARTAGAGAGAGGTVTLEGERIPIRPGERGLVAEYEAMARAKGFKTRLSEYPPAEREKVKGLRGLMMELGGSAQSLLDHPPRQTVTWGLSTRAMREPRNYSESERTGAMRRWNRLTAAYSAVAGSNLVSASIRDGARRRAWGMKKSTDFRSAMKWWGKMGYTGGSSATDIEHHLTSKYKYFDGRAQGLTRSNTWKLRTYRR